MKMAINGAFSAIALGVTIVLESWSFLMPHVNPMDSLILVNKDHKAPSVPVTLVKPSVSPCEERIKDNIYMRPDAAHALEQMFDDAKKEGIYLYARSGYRSYSTQKAIYGRKQRRNYGISSVAKPGFSEHQTGLAMDFEGKSTLGRGLIEEIGTSPEGIWVAQHCSEYGFIIRYPKGSEKITGYIYEPWHVRYVGVEAAKTITRLGITFEEYIQFLRSERLDQCNEETP